MFQTQGPLHFYLKLLLQDKNVSLTFIRPFSNMMHLAFFHLGSFVNLFLSDSQSAFSLPFHHTKMLPEINIILSHKELYIENICDCIGNLHFILTMMVVVNFWFTFVYKWEVLFSAFSHWNHEMSAIISFVGWSSYGFHFFVSPLLFCKK